MTKKQFQAFSLKNNCSAHYCGKKQIMYIFGNSSNLNVMSKRSVIKGIKFELELIKTS